MDSGLQTWDLKVGKLGPTSAGSNQPVVPFSPPWPCTLTISWFVRSPGIGMVPEEPVAGAGHRGTDTAAETPGL